MEARKLEVLSEEKEQKLAEANIFIVDDDKSVLNLMERRLKKMNYETVVMEDGTKAFDYIYEHKSEIDVVVVDRQMPEINGIDIVLRIKNCDELKHIPIIMQTASNSPDEIQEGIDAGVFYYLVKPVNKSVLKSVITAAVREANQNRSLDTELEKHKSSFNNLQQCRFIIKSLEDAEGLAGFVANCFPEPDRVISGMAELMINAIEHGNLGITYDEKTQLVDEGVWKESVQQRLSWPEFENKVVKVDFWRDDRGCYIKIMDEGKGFDWKKYMKIDPSRSTDNHGRGVAQANMISFDKMGYNDVGNSVTAFVSNDPPIEW